MSFGIRKSFEYAPKPNAVQVPGIYFSSLFKHESCSTTLRMTGGRPLPVVGALVFRPDGSHSNTGNTPTTAQAILKLGALVSDLCDVQHVWTREYTDLPGFGRLYVEAIFDDSCLIKGLPRNASFPQLAGDVILGCYLDVYKHDSNRCCEDKTLVNLPLLEIFDQKAVDAMVKGHRDRSSNALDLPFDRKRVMAAF